MVAKMPRASVDCTAWGSRCAPSRTAAGTTLPIASPMATTEAESETTLTQPGVAPRRLPHEQREQAHHHEGDEPAHGGGVGRDTSVVGRDRIGDGDRNHVGPAVGEHLDVEHQVEPRGGDQEPGGGRDGGMHRPGRAAGSVEAGVAMPVRRWNQRVGGRARPGIVRPATGT